MTKKRNPPPSRVRYERSHPTVTIRVDSELYEQLQEMRSTGGFSYAEVFRAGLDKASLVVGKALEEARQEGYQEGLAEGSEAAKRKYSVGYYCARCKRKHLIIVHDKEKAAAARLMFDAGWHSPRCSAQ